MTGFGITSTVLGGSRLGARDVAAAAGAGFSSLELVSAPGAVNLSAFLISGWAPAPPRLPLSCR